MSSEGYLALAKTPIFLTTLVLPHPLDAPPSQDIEINFAQGLKDWVCFPLPFGGQAVLLHPDGIDRPRIVRFDQGYPTPVRLVLDKCLILRQSE